MSTVAPVPEEFHTITPHLIVRGVPEAVEFYGSAFDARELYRQPAPDGKGIYHAELLLGDSRFFLIDESPEWGTVSPLALSASPVTLHLYVADVDRVFQQAVAAGAEVTVPLSDCFWGDRYGVVKDPFGHRWSIASRIEDLSPEELRQRADGYMRDGTTPHVKAEAVNGTGERKVAGMTDAAVRSATGRGWDDWFAVMDAVGAQKLSHKEIALILHEQHGCPGWWCQMITVGYEQERGLRHKNQSCSGDWQASGSKTLRVPVGTLFAAWEDANVRRQWLPDPEVTIRKATPNRSMRITWVDGKTSVDLWFTDKGDRSQISVQHRKLRDAGDVEEKRLYWKHALERLQGLLES